jgi:hypothetical protein
LAVALIRINLSVFFLAASQLIPTGPRSVAWHDMGAAMGAAATFQLVLELLETVLAHQRHEVAWIEALAMTTIKAEHPKRPLGAASIRQSFDGTHPMTRH